MIQSSRDFHFIGHKLYSGTELCFRSSCGNIGEMELQISVLTSSGEIVRVSTFRVRFEQSVVVD